MKIQTLAFLFCLFYSLAAFAQSTVGLVAYYPFDTAFTDATGNSANVGIPIGNPNFVCGVKENAVAFKGAVDQLNFIGPVTDEFDTEDFSISFYFKSTGPNGTQYILSKRHPICGSDSSFYIRYRPLNRTLNVVLSESAEKSVSLVEVLPEGNCWHHITIIRDATRVKLYLNGEFRQELATLSRIDISNESNLILGGSDCYGLNETSLDGIIDDLRFYNRALDDPEVEAGYDRRPDRILNRDTSIFLGESVAIQMGASCATGYNWLPTTGVSNSSAAEPVITPIFAGTSIFKVQLSDNISTCIAEDSIAINVVDPNSLDCSTVYLPNAFTPNGDGLNETFGVDNPFAIQNGFIALEVFDRWGGRVFGTADPFQRWDGFFQGQKVNPGVFLYRVRNICNGEELLTSGSVTIIR